MTEQQKEIKKPNFFKWTFLSSRGCIGIIICLVFAFINFSYIESSLITFFSALGGYLFISLIQYNSKFVWKPEPKEELEEELEDKTPKIKLWFENKGEQYRYKK